MKITRRQIRNLIREQWEDSYRKPRRYNQASPASMAAAKSLRAKFKRMYPGIPVKIDGRNGWIIVNGRKVVNMSAGMGTGDSREEMWEKMVNAAT